MRYFIIKRSNFNKIFYFEKEWYPIEVIEVELDATFTPLAHSSYVRLLDDEGNVYTRYSFELFDSREEAENFTGIYQAVGTDSYPNIKEENSITSSEIHISEIQMNELVGIPSGYCPFEENTMCWKLMGIHRLIFIKKGMLKEFLIWSLHDSPDRIKDKYSTWFIKGMGDLEVIEDFLKNFINLKCFPVLFFEDNYEIRGMDKFAKMNFKDLPVFAIEPKIFVGDKINTMRFSNYHWVIKDFSKEVNLFYCVNIECGGFHQFHGRDLFLNEDDAAEAILNRTEFTYNK
jgi:hypothetical protein